MRKIDLDEIEEQYRWDYMKWLSEYKNWEQGKLTEKPEEPERPAKLGPKRIKWIQIDVINEICKFEKKIADMLNRGFIKV